MSKNKVSAPRTGFPRIFPTIQKFRFCKTLIISLLLLVMGVGSVSATEKVNSINYSETFLPTVSTLPVANPVLSAPVFARTAPLFIETAPVFIETAPVFGETAPVLARTAPIFGKTAPVFIKIAPVFVKIAPVLYGIAPMRTRIVLVQTVIAALGTNVVPVLPKTAFILTETELFRARISQMPTRASPGITGYRQAARSGQTDLGLNASFLA